MKKLILLLIPFFYSLSLSAQAPDAFKYQTVVRNSTGKVLQNQVVALKVTILQGSAVGFDVYTEQHMATTNDFGLINISIGKGTIMSGNFANINWSTGLYYLKIEVDIAGGTNYVHMGTSQLMSVPYAKYAEKAGQNYLDKDTSPTNEIQNLTVKNDTLGISGANNIVLPRLIPDNTCVLSKSITPPSGYTYSGDYINSAVSNTWKTKSALPVALVDICGAANNGKIYVFGGYNGSFKNTCYEYNPATDTWTQKANMPTSRSSMACEVLDGKIYVIGGLNATVSFSNVEVYDPSTNTWTTKAPMPVSSGELASAVCKNKIYVFGGYNFVTGNLSSTYEYNPATDTWSAKASMTFARRVHKAATVGDIIYVMGGYDGTYIISTNQAYDPVNNTWTTKASTPTPNSDMYLGAYNSKIYMAAGFYNSTRLNSFYEYDPVSNTWTSRANLPTARSNPAATFLDNKLYIIGGGLSSGYSAVNEVYTFEVPYYIHCLSKP